MIKTLVVDDDFAVAGLHRRYLQGMEHFEVVGVLERGAGVVPFVQSGEVDLILLDVHLPDLTGLEVLAQLRAAGSDAHVIMITANNERDAVRQAVGHGVEDYLVKPFAFSELSARIQVLLRRTHGARDAAEPTQLRLGDLELDLVRRKASRCGQRLELTAKEFLLLTLFLRRKGEVLSRTEIAEQVWDMNFDSDTSVVEVAIRRLRTKIDVPFDTALLHTIRGMGYVMEDRNG